jgi:hypothetical protein
MPKELTQDDELDEMVKRTLNDAISGPGSPVSFKNGAELWAHVEAVADGYVVEVRQLVPMADGTTQAHVLNGIVKRKQPLVKAVGAGQLPEMRRPRTRH